MRFSTFALILFGAGLQIHEGYADKNFKSFQSKEIKNISSTEVKNVKKMLKTPTRQITQSPCSSSNNVVLSDETAKEIVSYYFVFIKEEIRCFDTSKVTNMQQFFQNTGIDGTADLSSWDVSSVTSMFVSYQSSQYLL